MSDTMGSFRIEIENPARQGSRRLLKSVLVDTSAELTWCPADVLDSLGVEARKLATHRLDEFIPRGKAPRELVPNVVRNLAKVLPSAHS
jgi:hypothetical protein